jgi:hypothetical protein
MRSLTNYTRSGRRVARSGKASLRPAKRVGFLAVVFLLPLVFSLLADRALGLIGFPAELPVRTAHPVNFKEVRRNIEFTYEFHTNSQGLRYREIPIEKPERTVRVFVVGDSMTDGWGVQAHETFSSLLESALTSPQRTVELINAGLSGTAPLEYGRVFLAVGLKYRPDALLICISANDVFGTPSDATPIDLYPDKLVQRSAIKQTLHSLWPRSYTLLYQLKDAHDDSGRFWKDDLIRTVSVEAKRRGLPQEEIDAWKARLPEDLVSAANRNAFNGATLAYGLLDRTYFTDSLNVDAPRAESKWNAMAAILTATVREARNNGVEVAAVFLPDRFQYDPLAHSLARHEPAREAGIYIDRSWLDTTSQLQRRLESWSESLQVPFLDTTPTFRKFGAEASLLTYPLDGHWTPAGHRVAAAAIGQWLREKRVFRVLADP